MPDELDRSASDDVLVEAFWRAYRGRARFHASRSFGAWLRRIATNAALDHGLVEPGDGERLTRRVVQCDGRACAPSWSKTYSAMTPVFGDPDAARSVNRIGPFGALRTKAAGRASTSSVAPSRKGTSVDRPHS